MILTADKDAQHGIRRLLEGRRLLIREIDFQCIVHPNHDGGVRSRGAEFLRAFIRTHERALVIFDHEGSGGEGHSSEELERSTEEILSINGWDGSCAAIVLWPELESWIWDDNLKVRKIANASMTTSQLRELLCSGGFLTPGQVKPKRPKEAFDYLLRATKTKRSASLFSTLAEEVEIEDCTDRAFNKLSETLRHWFPKI